MILISICGARPNFMKVAPVARQLPKTPDSGIEHIIVHTGQHYDDNMSKAFFKELNIPEPDINLEAGSGTHAFQTARIMETFETYMIDKISRCWIFLPEKNYYQVSSPELKCRSK